MKVIARRVRIGLALAALVLASAGPAAGQPAEPSGALVIAQTAREKEAITTLDQGRPVTARRIAEELLAADPESLVGHYVLGRVEHEADGALGQAIFHLGHARELYEQRYPVDRPAEAPWKFHRELLYSIAALAGEMEEYRYQLDIMDYHDAIYRPPMIAERAWPLMKLGRLDQARAAADQAAGLKTSGQRSLGLNVLCAIERANPDRGAARRACTAAFEHAKEQEARLPAIDKEHLSTVAIHAYNAALAARADLALDDAEKFALEGTRRLAFTPANPWRFLVELYVDQGRGGDAAHALREMQAWRKRQPPQLRDQDRAETDVTIATVLMLAGRTAPALRMVDRAVANPDRRGLTSTQAWQARGAHALLRRVLRRSHGEVLAELAATGAGGLSVRAGVANWLSGWSDDEAIAGVLSSDARLIDSFRPFGERGLTPVPVWLLGELVPVLGPGVTAVVLDLVAARDTDPRLQPYRDAVMAEIHLARGRTAEARALCQQVLGVLPDTERLLRARVAAVAAQAARDDGDGAAELASLATVVSLDPSALRRHRLALPVQVRAEGGASADAVARMLERSPRFRRGNYFAVVVSAVGDGFRICLRGIDGAELACTDATVDPDLPPAKPGPGGEPPPPPPPMTAARAVELFHRNTFAMPLGLTGVDVSSLDGSTTVAEQAVRERVDAMLGELGQ